MKLLNYQHHRYIDLIQSEIASTRGYKYQVQEKWETLEPSAGIHASEISKTIHYLKTATNATYLGDFGDALVSIDDSPMHNDVYVEILTDSVESAKKYLTKVKEHIKQASEPDTTEISVRFWYNTSNGPKAVHRNIDAPDWGEIAKNYTESTYNGLTHLMNKFTPKAGGKLILWHGEPGTGKTYALRALCQSWKNWCSVEYILDPEVLLGASPGYLASMIMGSETWEDDEDEEESTRPWKLLVMEDTGELLTDNARDRSGQGLARLLNVVDGFIGQGLKILILITTNEEFDKLHPAVSREGRCAASIKFDGLSPSEASEFLSRHGVEDEKSLDWRQAKYNIADLFAKLKNSDAPRDNEGIRRNGLGFRVPNTN